MTTRIFEVVLLVGVSTALAALLVRILTRLVARAEHPTTGLYLSILGAGTVPIGVMAVVPSQAIVGEPWGVFISGSILLGAFEGWVIVNLLHLRKQGSPPA